MIGSNEPHSATPKDEELPFGWHWEYGTAIKEKEDGDLWDFIDHGAMLRWAEKARDEWYEEDEETHLRDCVIVRRPVLDLNWNDGWKEYDA